VLFLTSLRKIAVIVYLRLFSEFLTVVLRVQAVLPTADICELYGKLLFFRILSFQDMSS